MTHDQHQSRPGPEGDRPAGRTGGSTRTAPGVPPGTPPIDPPDTPPILDQVFDGDSLYALRSAVEAHAVDAGMTPGRAEDMLICVHELATNAIRHGSGSGRARIWRLPGVLRCQVDDGGPPATADEVSAGEDAERAREQATEQAGDDPADRWPVEHGHGLWLIRYTADAMNLRSRPDGTRAVLVFTLPAPGPRPPFRVSQRETGAAGAPDRRRAVLTATGDLDRQAGSRLLATVTELVAGGHKEVILDLLGLDFWDTAGIAALSTLQHHIDDHPPARLTIVVPAPLRQTLRHTGLADRLTLADGIDLA